MWHVSKTKTVVKNNFLLFLKVGREYSWYNPLEYKLLTPRPLNPKWSTRRRSHGCTSGSGNHVFLSPLPEVKAFSVERDAGKQWPGYKWAEIHQNSICTGPSCLPPRKSHNNLAGLHIDVLTDVVFLIPASTIKPPITRPTHHGLRPYHARPDLAEAEGVGPLLPSPTPPDQTLSAGDRVTWSGYPLFQKTGPGQGTSPPPDRTWTGFTLCPVNRQKWVKTSYFVRGR